MQYFCVAYCFLSPSPIKQSILSISFWLIWFAFYILLLLSHPPFCCYLQTNFNCGNTNINTEGSGSSRIDQWWITEEIGCTKINNALVFPNPLGFFRTTNAYQQKHNDTKMCLCIRFFLFCNVGETKCYYSVFLYLASADRRGAADQ